QLEVAEDLFHRLVRPLGPVERRVRVVDVRLVVEIVVDPHRLRIDVRLECVVCVRKFWKLEGHASTICSSPMTTLAFHFEEIAPRELRPEVYELEGISRASVEAHYKLYQGYVNKRNEILK